VIAITTLAIKQTKIATWAQIQWRGMFPKLAKGRCVLGSIVSPGCTSS
jgi:hypothetical protein